MTSYLGTKTEENLHAAFSGESMARNKYTFFSTTARRQGFDEIADHFERLAKNEMMHAKLWFEALNGAPDTTEKNLFSAAQGEFDEWHSMYPGFAKQAREDGFEQLAVMFENVAKIERDHELQFMKLLASISNHEKTVHETVQSETKDGYQCIFCGAVFDSRPDVCEVCKAIGSFEPYSYEVNTQ